MKTQKRYQYQIINTKHKTTRKANKTSKPSKPGEKHHYFIIDCKFEKLVGWNTKFLEKHLQKLGLIPDKSMISYKNYRDNTLKKHNITSKEYCMRTKKINLIIPNTANVISNVFFYYLNGIYVNKPFYNYPKFLLNILNFDYLTPIKKDAIYENVHKFSPKLAEQYFIETFPINNHEKYIFPGNYILRPNDAFGGSDIIYIKNKKELTDAISYYHKTKNYKGILYGNNVIASKFITDLTIFKGKKYHIRMYYIISIINGVYSSFLWDEGKILTAKAEYDLNKPFTKDMHDTHVKSTDADYKFPEDFKSSNLNRNISQGQIKELYEKCKLMCSGISGIMKREHNTKSLLYSEQKNGYYIFGLDVLVRDNFEPVLIECNTEPGMTFRSIQGLNTFSKNIFQWINDVVLEPLFKYNDARIARKHPSYIHL